MLILHLAACHQDPRVRQRTEATLEEEFKAVDYPVVGSTWADVMRSVDAQAVVFGVAGNGEKPLHGKTIWKLDWDRHLTRKAFDCLLTVELSVGVTTVLPEWTPAADTDPALEVRWAAWLERLRVHEEGHRAIAVRAAHDLRDAAQALVPDPACRSPGEEVDRLGRTFSDRVKADQQAYDSLTEHGVQQERWVGVSQSEGTAP